MEQAQRRHFLLAAGALLVASRAPLAQQSPALVDNMVRLGGEVTPLTIQALVSRQAADRVRYGAFIKEAGIKGDRRARR